MNTDTRGVQARGNPEIHGELVHFKTPAIWDGTLDAKPLCSNGAYNLLWTENRSLVTCSKCKERV